MIRTRYGWIAIGIGLLAVAIIAGSLGARRTASKYEHQISDLRNQIALRDHTIEVQKGVFERRIQEQKDPLSIIPKDDPSIGNLKKAIGKGNKVQSLVSLDLRLKEPMLISGNFPQENVGERKKVSFDQTVSHFRVRGYTLTDPGQASIELTQVTPLKIWLSVIQASDGSWRAISSSNDGLQMDLGVGAVNPYMLSDKWYSRIGVNLAVGGGSTSGGFGILSAIGLSYRGRSLELGPTMWLTVSDRTERFFGVNAVWYPFSR